VVFEVVGDILSRAGLIGEKRDAFGG
jgi:hypothetical protein